MQEDKRRRLVHRHVDLDHAADFEVIGGGGDGALVGLQHLDRHALRVRRSAPRQRRGRNAESGVNAISGTPSGRIGPLAERL